jgi:hypothetical protein
MGSGTCFAWAEQEQIRPQRHCPVNQFIPYWSMCQDMSNVSFRF